MVAHSFSQVQVTSTNSNPVSRSVTAESKNSRRPGTPGTISSPKSIESDDNTFSSVGSKTPSLSHHQESSVFQPLNSASGNQATFALLGHAKIPMKLVPADPRYKFRLQNSYPLVFHNQKTFFNN